MLESRPTFAEVDLAALRANYALIRGRVPARTKLLAVVKADAYGHGFLEVSKELERQGVDAFGVAFLAEAIQLRKSGIDKPVLLLGGMYPGQERKCIGFSISCAVFSLDQVRLLNQAAGRLFRKASIHIKIDTGMGRLGVPYAELPAFLESLEAYPHISVDGLFSHFSSADEADSNGTEFTDRQVERFEAAVAQVHAAGHTPPYIHIANSAGALWQRCPACTMVRPGIVLYGALPSADFAGQITLQPVLRLRSAIAMLKWIEPGDTVSYGRWFTAKRRTRIASVPVGYADGYPRSLTNRGEVLIRGRRVPVVGTVCMDWLMVDVTDLPDVKVGDDVTLWGRDRSGQTLYAEEVAERAGTIPYELLCGVSKRVPRVYLHPGS